MGNPHPQPSLSCYWEQGFRNGQSIASANLSVTDEDLKDAVNQHCEDDATSLLATIATVAESEHFRQFSPFEQLARELNAWDEVCERWADAENRDRATLDAILVDCGLPADSVENPDNVPDSSDVWKDYEDGVQSGIAHELALPCHSAAIADIQQRIDNLAS